MVCSSSHIFILFSIRPVHESELSSELVEGAERTYPLGGLLSVTWGALSQSSGGMFLRLLLGSEQLSSAGYVQRRATVNQQGEFMSLILTD